MLSLVTIILTFTGLPAQLLITQYYEGPSNDKYLEITNMGSTTYDLAAEGVYAYLFANERADDPASTTASLGQALSGIIAPLASVVFKNGLAAEPVYAADIGQGVNFCGFNGDDLVILSYATDGLTSTGSAWSQRIDVVGDGSDWGQDVSFRRKAEVNSPNTEFSFGEWTTVSITSVNTAANGTTDYLGFHLSALPIVMGDFKAYQEDGAAVIHFTTVMEHQNDYFVVEHSTSGQNFRVLTKINARGDGQHQQDYHYRHEVPSLGWNYYRLKQVDRDGQWQYFGLVSVRMISAKEQLSIGPVPSSDMVWI